MAGSRVRERCNMKRRVPLFTSEHSCTNLRSIN